MSSLLMQANIVRIQFETKAIRREVLARLYGTYNHTVDIDSFLDEAAQLFPHLNCGLASVYLQYALKAGEIIQGRYQGQPHTFLRIGELIVDITADQFHGPQVYVGPLKAPWSVR